MINQNVLDALANEDYGDDNLGPFNYEGGRAAPRPILARYKVWNPNPQNLEAPKTPGIVMTVTTKTKVNGKDEYTYTDEIVESVNAVLLFSSPGRKLAGAKGAVICSSHDGVVPSLRIDQPLCRDTSAADVAKVFSQWKGYDEAKVKDAVKEATENSDQLKICGLKGSNGMITLCPYGKKDQRTGQAPACKQNIFVHGYDIDRKREFKMVLTGGSISYGNFIAPYHEFYKFLRTQGPVNNGRASGLPSYIYSVRLSSLPNRAYFVLNVKDYKLIEQAENRQDMKARAQKAKEMWEKDAHRLSKEEYLKIKTSKKLGTTDSANSPTQPGSEMVQVAAANVTPAQSPAIEDDVPQVSFDDDDIPF